MAEDLLLVATADVLILDWFTRLRIYPTNVERAILQASVEVLDETHHPGHLDTAFDREFSARFHLPTSTRAAPRTDFCEPGDNDNLLEVEHAPQL